MSGDKRSQTDQSLDVDELLQFGSRCKELRKEKELLKESQSQSFGLIRRLELHVTSLLAARSEDKKRIAMLEKELMNCSQEIDYLQDLLNSRNTEVDSLEEQVQNLESRLEEMEKLREEVERSDSDCLFLIQKLENRETELRSSSLCIEKLRESISSLMLDSQCEIESMNLDIVALEQNCIEADEEKVKLNQLTLELEAQNQDAQKIIGCLELENKELREKLDSSETQFKVFRKRVEKWMENDGSEFDIKSISNYLQSKLTVAKDIRTFGEDPTPELEMILKPDEDVMETTSKPIMEYELLVSQLKEELREEKVKAKEELEDLAQEMAELRYQMTCLLEEEHSRRARVEQASLQRIAELESQVQKERREPFHTVKHLHGA